MALASGAQRRIKVCKELWPFAQTKLHKIEQIIDHYDPEVGNENVVSLESYRNEKR